MKKKQVAQLDNGMCAMACEQMRQVMETLRWGGRGEEAIDGIKKQARAEELQRVAELEERVEEIGRVDATEEH